jgi:hypothetical protein
MRVELRDDQRHKIGRVDVDPALRPTRVVVERNDGSRIGLSPSPQAIDVKTQTQPSREVFLHWDTALDDAGQLRRCVACGCGDLFREKAFPQVTAVIVILAFLGAIVGAVGMANTPVLFAMLVILILDVAILVLSRNRLVCYRCRTAYRDLPIARYHRPWDRALADRHPAPAPAAAEAAAPAAAPVRPLAAPQPAPAEQTNYFASS